jgi:hypothetical protein
MCKPNNDTDPLIPGLFNNALQLHRLYIIKLEDGYELERLWEEAVVAYFIVLAQHLHGQTKKNCDNLQDSQSPG